MAVEIGARLMWGGDLGLPPEERAGLADIYTQLLGEHNGKRADAAIDEIRERHQLPRQTAGVVRSRENQDRPAHGNPRAGNPAHRGFAFARRQSPLSLTAPPPAAPARAPRKIPEPILDALELGAEMRDDWRRAFNPMARGEEALTAALSLREWGATAARDYDRAKLELKEARKFFRGQPFDVAIAFINAIESDDQADRDALPEDQRKYDPASATPDCRVIFITVQIPFELVYWQNPLKGISCPVNVGGTKSPATPGEIVVLYAWGVGPTVPLARTGDVTPAPASPTWANDVQFNFSPNAPPSKPYGGFFPFEFEFHPRFIGLVQGQIGLNQINVKLPDTFPDVQRCDPSRNGICAIQSNLTITVGGANSFDGAAICTEKPAP
jgi:hypothetical protein